MAYLLSQKKARELLIAHGWTVREGGGHDVMMVKDGQRPIPLSHKQGQNYSKDYTSRLLRQAGLTRKDML